MHCDLDVASPHASIEEGVSSEQELVEPSHLQTFPEASFLHWAWEVAAEHLATGVGGESVHAPPTHLQVAPSLVVVHWVLAVASEHFEMGSEGAYNKFKQQN